MEMSGTFVYLESFSVTFKLEISGVIVKFDISGKAFLMVLRSVFPAIQLKTLKRQLKMKRIGLRIIGTSPKVIRQKSVSGLEGLKTLNFLSPRVSLINSRRVKIESKTKRMGLNVKGTIEVTKVKKLDKNGIESNPPLLLEG